MTRDMAIRLDAMLMAARGSLDMIAHQMKNNLTAEEYKAGIYRIGRSMAELVEISNGLHKAYPDIVPKELK